jgi:GNAT superfamily N-acetyltransferase
VAYRGEVLVGCTTVRPAVGPEATSVVIVRVLAEHRGQGFGTQLYGRASAAARALGAGQIETVVWEPNVDGLRFAAANGFVEVSRYLPPDEDDAFLTLRLH